LEHRQLFLIGFGVREDERKGFHHYFSTKKLLKGLKSFEGL
jgi:hypothetical protein